MQKMGIPKESPKQQNCNYCRLGLTEPVHGRLQQNSTFKHGLSKVTFQKI